MRDCTSLGKIFDRSPSFGALRTLDITNCLKLSWQACPAAWKARAHLASFEMSPHHVLGAGADLRTKLLDNILAARDGSRRWPHDLPELDNLETWLGNPFWSSVLLSTDDLRGEAGSLSLAKAVFFSPTKAHNTIIRITDDLQFETFFPSPHASCGGLRCCGGRDVASFNRVTPGHRIYGTTKRILLTA